MSKIYKTFKFNSDGRIDLRDNTSLIKTPEPSGTKYKYWLGTKDNLKSFLVKTTPQDKLCDVAEVITSKMLKSLNLPYVETALAQTLIEEQDEKQSFLDKFLKPKKNVVKTFSNCVISENISRDENTISAEDIFALAEEKYRNVNPELLNKIKSHSSLQEFETAISLLDKFSLPKETILDLQKLIIFDYATGQTDRSPQDIIFNVDKNNNLTLAPIIDNEMINFFYYKNQIFHNYANKPFDPENYKDSFIPIFTFSPSKEIRYSISQDIENYGNIDSIEMLEFTKKLYDLNIPSIFDELKQETGLKMPPNIPTFFNNYKNSKCEILLNTLTNSLNTEENNSDIFEETKDFDTLPEI